MEIASPLRDSWHPRGQLQKSGMANEGWSPAALRQKGYGGGLRRRHRRRSSSSLVVVVVVARRRRRRRRRRRSSSSLAGRGWPVSTTAGGTHGSIDWPIFGPTFNHIGVSRRQGAAAVRRWRLRHRTTRRSKNFDFYVGLCPRKLVRASCTLKATPHLRSKRGCARLTR